MDIWIVRFNKIPPFNFWGFQQLEDTEIEDVIRQVRAVLFLGGSNSHNATEMHLAVEQVLFWFPDMLEQQVQQVRQIPLQRASPISAKRVSSKGPLYADVAMELGRSMSQATGTCTIRCSPGTAAPALKKLTPCRRLASWVCPYP